MPYSVTLYKFDKVETPDKKKAIILARIEARQEKWICYVDIISRRVLNAKEMEAQKMDSIEYSLDSRIEITPNGKVTEL